MFRDAFRPDAIRAARARARSTARKERAQPRARACLSMASTIEEPPVDGAGDCATRELVLNVFRRSTSSLPGVIAKIEIWRVANLMLKRYGDRAQAESVGPGRPARGRQRPQGCCRLAPHCRRSRKTWQHHTFRAGALTFGADVYLELWRVSFGDRALGARAPRAPRGLSHPMPHHSASTHCTVPEVI
jgi:hypothetical protein